MAQRYRAARQLFRIARSAFGGSSKERAPCGARLRKDSKRLLQGSCAPQTCPPDSVPQRKVPGGAEGSAGQESAASTSWADIADCQASFLNTPLAFKRNPAEARPLCHAQHASLKGQSPGALARGSAYQRGSWVPGPTAGVFSEYAVRFAVKRITAFLRPTRHRGRRTRVLRRPTAAALRHLQRVELSGAAQLGRETRGEDVVSWIALPALREGAPRGAPSTVCASLTHPR